MLHKVIGPNTSMVRTGLQTNSCPSQAHCIILENGSCVCYCIYVATGYPGFKECLSKYGCYFKMSLRRRVAQCPEHLPSGFPPSAKHKNNLNSNLTRLEAIMDFSVNATIPIFYPKWIRLVIWIFLFMK